MEKAEIQKDNDAIKEETQIEKIDETQIEDNNISMIEQNIENNTITTNETENREEKTRKSFELRRRFKSFWKMLSNDDMIVFEYDDFYVSIGKVIEHCSLLRKKYHTKLRLCNYSKAVLLVLIPIFVFISNSSLLKFFILVDCALLSLIEIYLSTNNPEKNKTNIDKMVKQINLEYHQFIESVGEYIAFDNKHDKESYFRKKIISYIQPMESITFKYNYEETNKYFE